MAKDGYEFDLTLTDPFLGDVHVFGIMADLGTVTFGPEEWWITHIYDAVNWNLRWFLPEESMNDFIQTNHATLQSAINERANDWVGFMNSEAW